MPENNDALDDIVPGPGENNTPNDETNKNTSETPQNDQNEGDEGEGGENTQETPPTPPESEKQDNNSEPEPEQTPAITHSGDPTEQVPLPTTPANLKPVDQLDILNLSTVPEKSDYSKKPESGKIEVRNKEVTFNKQGEPRYSPEEVMSLLALYDDFTNVRGYEKTRYQLEFERMAQADRIADLKTTKELLKRQGHDV
jgi:hypothetical protein